MVLSARTVIGCHGAALVIDGCATARYGSATICHDGSDAPEISLYVGTLFCLWTRGDVRATDEWMPAAQAEGARSLLTGLTYSWE